MLKFFDGRESGAEVVMEACASAHYWGRRLLSFGYRVRLIPAQHVRAYVLGNKTDANDADAIYAISRRKDIRPVQIKTVVQQDALLVHNTRERLIAVRTALINQLRGVLAERGVVFRQRVDVLRRELVAWLEKPAEGEVTSLLQHWVRERRAEWARIDEEIASCDQQMRQWHQATPACVQISEVEGIGIITATAVVASVGDARQFDSGRQFASWLGLTPKERSSGSMRHLGGITKRGDGYLRKLLVHGARAAVLAARHKRDSRSSWINALVARCGHNKAVVALANKNARVLWALLTTGECYRKPKVLAA
jgi:transposase